MKNREVEFRFKMDEKFFNETVKAKVEPIIIQQGYLQDKDKEHTRVRIETFSTGKKVATLTTKTGEKPARMEYESKIDVEQAEILFKSCKFKLIKHRYVWKEYGFTWEIDWFPSEKILMVEIELESIGTPFPRPLWLKEDVTFNKKFSNMTIAKKKKKIKK